MYQTEALPLGYYRVQRICSSSKIGQLCGLLKLRFHYLTFYYLSSHFALLPAAGGYSIYSMNLINYINLKSQISISGVHPLQRQYVAIVWDNFHGYSLVSLITNTSFTSSFLKNVRVFTCVQMFILLFNPILPFSTLYTTIKVSSLFNIMVLMQWLFGFIFTFKPCDFVCA